MGGFTPGTGPMSSPVWQLGFVVEDLEQSLRDWSNHLGGGPWHIYTYSSETLPVLEYEGRKAGICYRLAMSQALVPQIELIESVRGPSVYDPWLLTHGPGLHHLAYRVASLEESIRQMDDMGYQPVQVGAKYGLDGDGGFAYFDLRRNLGVFVELIEIPGRRRPPEAIWTGSDFYVPRSATH